MRAIKYRITFLLTLFLLSFNVAASNIILVTGFEPFGGSKYNGSWEAIKNLNGKHIGDAEIVVAMLPVLWDIAAMNLHNLVNIYQPAMIISFGEFDNLPIGLETVAHNTRDKYYDNHHSLPKTSYIYQDGPNQINTTLPVSSIQSTLIKLNLPYRISDNADTYLCNEIFYTLMYDPGTQEAKSIPRGFVHLPAYMSRIKNNKGEIIIFDQDTLQLAAESIVTAAAKVG